MTQPHRSADATDEVDILDNITTLEDHGRRRHPAAAHYALTKHEWWVAAAVGVWLAVLGIASLLAIMWSWAVADRAGANGTAVRWIGPDFTATSATSALALAAAAGVTGSVVHATSLFAARVGRRTFEVSFFWWYLLRPIEAALVAVVLVAAVRSGLVALNPTGSGAATALAFLVGALGGLFTDRAMQRLRGLLGATKPDAKASEQAMPGAFAAS